MAANDRMNSFKLSNEDQRIIAELARKTKPKDISTADWIAQNYTEGDVENILKITVKESMQEKLRLNEFDNESVINGKTERDLFLEEHSALGLTDVKAEGR